MALSIIQAPPLFAPCRNPLLYKVQDPDYITQTGLESEFSLEIEIGSISNGQTITFDFLNGDSVTYTFHNSSTGHNYINYSNWTTPQDAAADILQDPILLKNFILLSATGTGTYVLSFQSKAATAQYNISFSGPGNPPFGFTQTTPGVDHLYDTDLRTAFLIFKDNALVHELHAFFRSDEHSYADISSYVSNALQPLIPQLSHTTAQKDDLSFVNFTIAIYQYNSQQYYHKYLSYHYFWNGSMPVESWHKANQYPEYFTATSGRKFLSSAPIDQYVHPDQFNLLSIYLGDLSSPNPVIHFKYYFLDGTSQTESTSFTLNQLSITTLQVGLNHHSFHTLPIDPIAYYDVWITHSSGLTSETRTFILSKSVQRHALTCLFENEFGQFDSFSFSGYQVHKESIVRQDADMHINTRNLQRSSTDTLEAHSQFIPIESTPSISCNSGQISEEELLWLRNIYTSPTILLHLDEGLIPYTIDTTDKQIIDTEKSSRSFEMTFIRALRNTLSL